MAIKVDIRDIPDDMEALYNIEHTTRECYQAKSLSSGDTIRGMDATFKGQGIDWYMERVQFTNGLATLVTLSSYDSDNKLVSKQSKDVTSDQKQVRFRIPSTGEEIDVIIDEYLIYHPTDVFDGKIGASAVTVKDDVARNNNKIKTKVVFILSFNSTEPYIKKILDSEYLDRGIKTDGRGSYIFISNNQGKVDDMERELIDRGLVSRIDRRIYTEFPAKCPSCGSERIYTMVDKCNDCGNTFGFTPCAVCKELLDVIDCKNCMR